MTTAKVTPSVTITLSLNERDIEYLAWTTVQWTQAAQDADRFIVHDRDEFVVAPLGSDVHFFFHYSEALLARAYFVAKGRTPILAMDEEGGNWAVIVP